MKGSGTCRSSLRRHWRRMMNFSGLLIVRHRNTDPQYSHVCFLTGEGTAKEKLSNNLQAGWLSCRLHVGHLHIPRTPKVQSVYSMSRKDEQPEEVQAFVCSKDLVTD